MSNTWIDPYPGFQYHEDTISVSTEFQREKLTQCGIDSGVFGNQVDPSFFIGIAIHAGINSGISAEGNVNMVQMLHQHRPALLDEPLTVRGEITAVDEVPRGRALHTSVTFWDSTNLPVIRANRVSLKPDPDKIGQRGAGERPAPVIQDVFGLELKSTYQLTPERVKGYSSEGNSIHYEEAAARAAGFRAPLIGGGMGVHYLMAELWKLQTPNEFLAEIYFRRPIFWDETIQVGLCNAQDKNLLALGLVKPLSKVGTEVRISYP